MHVFEIGGKSAPVLKEEKKKEKKEKKKKKKIMMRTLKTFFNSTCQ